MRAAAETRVTFSIVAGHFELIVNPSQRTGVIGGFLTPVQASSDLPLDYCNVCTLHLFTHVLQLYWHLATAVVGLIFFCLHSCGLLQITLSLFGLSATETHVC